MKLTAPYDSRLLNDLTGKNAIPGVTVQESGGQLLINVADETALTALKEKAAQYRFELLGQDKFVESWADGPVEKRTLKPGESFTSNAARIEVTAGNRTIRLDNAQAGRVQATVVGDELKLTINGREYGRTVMLTRSEPIELSLRFPVY